MATPTLEELDVEGVTVGENRGVYFVQAGVTYKDGPLRFVLPSATVRREPVFHAYRARRKDGEWDISFDVPEDIAAAMQKLEAAIKPGNRTWGSSVDVDPVPSIRAKLLLHEADVRSKRGTRLQKLPCPWRVQRASAVLRVRWLNIRSANAFLELHVEQMQLGAE
jgi:hypothetical protein